MQSMHIYAYTLWQTSWCPLGHRSQLHHDVRAKDHLADLELEQPHQRQQKHPQVPAFGLCKLTSSLWRLVSM